jgi:hypothetical protein
VGYAVHRVFDPEHFREKSFNTPSDEQWGYLREVRYRNHKEMGMR